MSEVKIKKKRAPKTVFTIEDLAILTPEFETNPRPSARRITEIANLLTYSDKVVSGWFGRQRDKVKKQKEEEAEAIAEQIENKTVETVDESAAQKQLRKAFSRKAEKESVSGSYVIVYSPSHKYAKASNDVPGMLKSIVKAGNFYRLTPAERMSLYREHKETLKNDKSGDYRMLLITHYDSNSIIPEYGFGRKGIASTSDEFFICSNWESFSKDFDSFPGYGTTASAVTDDIFELSAQYKDEFLDLIVEKLLTADYVDERIECKDCHVRLMSVTAVRAHEKSCSILKWNKMSAEKKVGLISCPHCHFVFTMKAGTKYDRRIRCRDYHILNSCDVLKWQKKQGVLKKAEAQADEQKLDVKEDENILARNGAIKDALARKFAKYDSPYHQLQLHYSTSKCKNFSEEEDRFMVCKLHELGIDTPDVYENIRVAFTSAPQFRRDWFIRSRTAQDLSKRCAILIQLVKKEYAAEDEPEKPPKAQKRTVVIVNLEIPAKKQKN